MIEPQSLDNAIWDAVVALTKLRVRILHNGDSLNGVRRDVYAKFLANTIEVMSQWSDE